MVYRFDSRLDLPRLILPLQGSAGMRNVYKCYTHHNDSINKRKKIIIHAHASPWINRENICELYSGRRNNPIGKRPERVERVRKYYNKGVHLP